VSNLVDTVNAVKNALANVAPAFQQDVASFVIPLAPGTEIQQGNPVTVVIQTPETQIIISNDNP
jgi:copper chaperone CopZ